MQLFDKSSDQPVAVNKKKIDTWLGVSTPWNLLPLSLSVLLVPK